MNNSAQLEKELRYQQWFAEVQEIFVDELQESQASHTIVPTEQNPPVQTFVELPAPISEPKPVTHGVVSIICGNARIEISEDISED